MLATLFHRRSPHTRALWALIALCIVFAGIRFAAIDERTIHIDEGMGLRVSEFALAGDWVYSPYNGHGPTLFFLGAVVEAFFGTDLIAARGLTIVFNIASLALLLWTYWGHLRWTGRFVLATTFGLSSGMVFFSAYFIHESIFIFFTILTLAGVEKWIETKRPVWIVTAGAALALMYTTKETAVLTWMSWALALIALLFWHKPARKIVYEIPIKTVLSAAVIAFIIYAVLITGFGTNFESILNGVAALFHWSNRAAQMHHQPPYYYVRLLSVHEPLLLYGSMLTAALAFVARAWNPYMSFFFVRTIIIIGLYSSIAYKTPWLTPNFLVPLILFSAFGIESVMQKLSALGRSIYASVMIVLLTASVWMMIRDGFGMPDRVSETSYAYLQSDQSLQTMIDTLPVLAELYGRERMPLRMLGRSDELMFVATEEYDRSLDEFAPGFPVYIGYYINAADVMNMLDATGDEYVRAVFTYIRDVNQIDLYVRKDLWQRYEEDARFVPPRSASDRLYDYR